MSKEIHDYIEDLVKGQLAERLAKLIVKAPMMGSRVFFEAREGLAEELFDSAIAEGLGKIMGWAPPPV